MSVTCSRWPSVDQEKRLEDEPGLGLRIACSRFPDQATSQRPIRTWVPAIVVLKSPSSTLLSRGKDWSNGQSDADVNPEVDQLSLGFRSDRAAP